MVSGGDVGAIALRITSDHSDFVAVIDGGYEKQGIELVHIIKDHYGRNDIDLLVSTHPDEDHLEGLNVVVNNLDVNHVWVHDPAQHGIRGLLGTTTSSKSLIQAREFIKHLDRNDITRSEPFSGSTYGDLVVLGPSKNFYEEMLVSFGDNETPETQNELADLLSGFADTSATLDEKNDTSAENNSSVMLGMVYDGDTYMFTGDVGEQGLLSAQANWQFEDIYWLDVPHHGSKHNLSTSLVDYLRPTLSYISAEGSRKHPSQAVVNALKKHGRVYSTHKSNNLCHNRGMPDREGYVTAIPL
jgi:beta-lactamase superfamily II metal-dependent hydrolase